MRNLDMNFKDDSKVKTFEECYVRKNAHAGKAKLSWFSWYNKRNISYDTFTRVWRVKHQWKCGKSFTYAFQIHKISFVIENKKALVVRLHATSTHGVADRFMKIGDVDGNSFTFAENSHERALLRFLLTGEDQATKYTDPFHCKPRITGVKKFYHLDSLFQKLELSPQQLTAVRSNWLIPGHVHYELDKDHKDFSNKFSNVVMRKNAKKIQMGHNYFASYEQKQIEYDDASDSWRVQRSKDGEQNTDKYTNEFKLDYFKFRFDFKKTEQNNNGSPVIKFSPHSSVQIRFIQLCDPETGAFLDKNSPNMLFVEFLLRKYFDGVINVQFKPSDLKLKEKLDQKFVDVYNADEKIRQGICSKAAGLEDIYEELCVHIYGEEHRQRMKSISKLL